MGSIWLHDLPDWLRAEPRLKVATFSGWELRSRSTGGFDRVLAIGTHHTASRTTPLNDMTYQWNTALSRPIGNIHLARDGVITVGAAGAANTQGKGGPYAASKGIIPLDAGNRFMLAIEAANDGIGEVWPKDQLDAYLLMCAVLCDRLGLDPYRDIVGHATWAPSRKVDPRGPTPAYPTLGGTEPGSTVIWPDQEFSRLVIIVGQPVAPTPPSLRAGVPVPVLKAGSTGPEATLLIAVLKWWQWYPAKYLGDVNDGVIGARSTEGIRSMQTALAQPVTGVYDLATATAYSDFLGAMMEAVCTLPAAPLRTGDISSEVRRLQTFLADRGWYTATIDGSYGPITTQAVQKLQRAASAFNPGPIDGQYGPQTRSAACQYVAT